VTVTPWPGLTLLSLFTGSERSRPDSHPRASGWGVRARWIW
jgi:hypothetical protein